MPPAKRVRSQRWFPPETRQLIRWINRHHAGNVGAAARQLGVSYESVRWPIRRGVRPSLDVYLRLQEEIQKCSF